MVIVGFLLAVLACTLPSSSSESAPEYDTLTVKGRTVIFFEPTEAEYSNLPKDKSIYTQEMGNEFRYYARAVSEKLKGTGILVFKTSAHFISVEGGKGNVTLNRISTGKTLGVIFASPDQRPLVIGDKDSGDEFIASLVPYFTQKKNN